MNKNILKYAGMNAGGTVLYIALVATFFTYAEQIFGGGPDKKTILIPIAMLTLFVFSAAVTGSLVLGRPILWYMEGKKKEALTLLGYTLGALFLCLIISFILLVLAS